MSVNHSSAIAHMEEAYKRIVDRIGKERFDVPADFFVNPNDAIVGAIYNGSHDDLLKIRYLIPEGVDIRNRGSDTNHLRMQLVDLCYDEGWPGSVHVIFYSDREEDQPLEDE
ncbi:hypothetical protein [Stratiformator vulcanicus]|uniref:Uncharacterized protein n=1 Tax=Stratiformator vulcanicus TaxID=2527980 RepID=A0A517R191_9PLAN|nr:hypothetical protein [Stratiformator vulcanicus]QDT37657.1 hypothetical protein Pan189_20370 [Stratiformator vulcanicus]